MKKFFKGLAIAGLAAGTLAACETSGLGEASSGLLSGGSGGSASTQSDIYRCSEPQGRIAIRDVSQQQYRSRYRAALGGDSMAAILREIVQASDCFKVIAAADDAINQDLEKIYGDAKTSSNTRPGSDLQDGQAFAADYALYPTVIFKEQETSSSGGLLGGIIPTGSVPVIGGAAAKTDIRSSEVALEVYSVRSRARLAGGTGQGNVRNISLGGLAVPGIPAGGAFKTASKSPEGKATLKAVIAAYNEMVVALQNYEKQEVDDGGAGGLLE